jgi:hypothetical protein
MSSVPDAVWIAETGLTVLFIVLLVLLRKKASASDSILWFTVWLTRVFASLNGSQPLAGRPSQQLAVYVGLQACSALSLVIVLMCFELRLRKQKLQNQVLLQMGAAGPPSRPAGGVAKAACQEASITAA